MANLPHEIISTAFKSRYSGSPKASLDHLFNNFSNGTSEEMKAELIKEILDALELKGYLKWYVSRRDGDKDKFIWDETFKLDFADSKRSYCFYDLTLTHISAALTPEGIDYAIDIERKKIKNRIDFLAIIFAFLTVVLSGTSLYKTIISQNKLEKTEQDLQTHMTIIDSVLQIQKIDTNNSIDKLSLKNSSQKDTPTLKRNLINKKKNEVKN